MSTIAYAALSDRGRTHDENQDRWLADPGRGLYLVSDGMGEAISPQLVVDTLPGLLRQLHGLIRLRVPKITDALRQRLADLPGVQFRERGGREVELACDDTKSSLVRVLAALNERKTLTTKSLLYQTEDEGQLRWIDAVAAHDGVNDRSARTSV